MVVRTALTDEAEEGGRSVWTTTGPTEGQSPLNHTSEGVSHSHFSLSRLLPPEIGQLER